MNLLFNNIVHYKKSIETHMKYAAEKGLKKYVLFSFDNQAEFQGFPLLFLTKGPYNYVGYTSQFFDTMNVDCYIKLLKKHFAPFIIYFYTNF